MPEEKAPDESSPTASSPPVEAEEPTLPLNRFGPNDPPIAHISRDPPFVLLRALEEAAVAPAATVAPGAPTVAEDASSEGPIVEGAQTVAGTVKIDSGWPFVETVIRTDLPRPGANNAALQSTTGEVPPPPVPLEEVPSTVGSPSAEVSFSAQGGLHADTNIIPAPVTVAPTRYPDDPAAPLVVRNYVRINLRSAEFQQSDTKLDELIRVLRQSNQIAGESRDQLVAEITAGRALLTAPKPDRNLLNVLLLGPLYYLADKAGSAVVGVLADEALHLLLRMFDTPIPL